MRYQHLTAEFTAKAASTSENSSSVVFSTDSPGYCSECGTLNANIDPDTTNFTVVKVVKITSDTDYIGKIGTVVVYAGERRKGNTVKITAQIAPSVSSLPKDFIQWSGGFEIKISEIEINLSKKEEKHKTITATCGTSSVQL